MLLELFLIGSFWFWAIMVVEAGWLLYCLHEESGGGIGGSLVVLSLILLLFGDFNVFSWIWFNPVLMLECAAAYLIVGSIWSVVRFKLLCTDARDLLEDTKEEFKEEHKIEGPIPADMREKWRKFAGSKSWPGSDRWSKTISTIADVIPKPRNNKATILYWMGYWPLSMLWFFLHDMIERIVTRIYRAFAKMYEAIARNTFVGVDDDFKERGLNEDSDR